MSHPKIMRRMADESRELTGGRRAPAEVHKSSLIVKKGEFAVDLKHPFRLVFHPNHEPIPLKEDGGIDLKLVTSIAIIDVEDYH